MSSGIVGSTWPVLPSAKQPVFDSQCLRSELQPDYPTTELHMDSSQIPLITCLSTNITNPYIAISQYLLTRPRYRDPKTFCYHFVNQSTGRFAYFQNITTAAAYPLLTLTPPYSIAVP